MKKAGFGGSLHVRLGRKKRSLRACVTEMEEASETRASKAQTKRRTADVEMVAEQAQRERAEYTARIVQLEDNSA